MRYKVNPKGRTSGSAKSDNHKFQIPYAELQNGNKWISRDILMNTYHQTLADRLIYEDVELFVVSEFPTYLEQGNADVAKVKQAHRSHLGPWRDFNGEGLELGQNDMLCVTKLCGKNKQYGDGCCRHPAEKHTCGKSRKKVGGKQEGNVQAPEPHPEPEHESAVQEEANLFPDLQLPNLLADYDQGPLFSDDHFPDGPNFEQGMMLAGTLSAAGPDEDSWSVQVEANVHAGPQTQLPLNYQGHSHAAANLMDDLPSSALTPWDDLGHLPFSDYTQDVYDDSAYMDNGNCLGQVREPSSSNMEDASYWDKWSQ